MLAWPALYRVDLSAAHSVAACFGPGDKSSSDPELRRTECFLLQKRHTSPQDLWRMEGAGLPLVLFSVLSFEQSGHCASQPDEVCATVTLFYK